MSDLRAQLRWPAGNRDPAQIEALRNGSDEAMALLAATPGVGSLQGADDSRVLRKLILRRLPFLIWYTYDQRERTGDLWLLRLFHVRQHRPR